MSIRFASKEDCAAIAEIYNHAVLHTAAIWNDQTVDAENRISWYQARQLMGYAWCTPRVRDRAPARRPRLARARATRGGGGAGRGPTPA